MENKKKAEFPTTNFYMVLAEKQNFFECLKLNKEPHRHYEISSYTRARMFV